MARFNRRTVKRLYRKEPVSSFLIVMGLIEVVIGGVDEHWGLFTIGLGFVLGAIAIRWSRIRRDQRDLNRVLPRRYLPPTEVNVPLPQLMNERQR
ncbi:MULTISPECIES: hypothetical protein [Cyanophyceae]|uniref:hypothetical protein n=1 Tax=Cyanophyceae TaxID=3028117 RepID=UPI00016DC708|nr:MULTISPECIES: hypothetical protein [Cyanophyceae]ACA98147.1 conserved hypothetical protein [Picosynechococcus sp. PCC 7002]AMA07973.1 hypothetical protein AWQ23_00800 [Picosynechococcus sp. PCC 73109]ANV83034.1 hypothetical protein AWQ21_00660 [Picosynechococcus sp. PCC 7003]ANV89288.1 hypothetical protein AWQ24_00740 [Picosynechococcus sp. PCC 8807]QCS48793.1 hypothetical protein FEK30_04705 [Picosynechococcus sp. PCC 11901]